MLQLQLRILSKAGQTIIMLFDNNKAVSLISIWPNWPSVRNKLGPVSEEHKDSSLGGCLQLQIKPRVWTKIPVTPQVSLIMRIYLYYLSSLRYTCPTHPTSTFNYESISVSHFICKIHMSCSPDQKVVQPLTVNPCGLLPFLFKPLN